MNQDSLKRNDDYKNIIEEVIVEKLRELSLDDLQKLQLKIYSVAGINLSMSQGLVKTLYEAIVDNILLPEYETGTELSKAITKLEIRNIFKRITGKIDQIILRGQLSPCTVLIGDERSIGTEFDMEGSLSGSIIQI